MLCGIGSAFGTHPPTVLTPHPCSPPLFRRIVALVGRPWLPLLLVCKRWLRACIDHGVSAGVFALFFCRALDSVICLGCARPRAVHVARCARVARCVAGTAGAHVRARVESYTRHPLGATMADGGTVLACQRARRGHVTEGRSCRSPVASEVRLLSLFFSWSLLALMSSGIRTDAASHRIPPLILVFAATTRSSLRAQGTTLRACVSSCATPRWIPLHGA